MSQGERISLAEARALASDVVVLLRQGSVRVEIAGSIRRERATVGDIEIVAIPRIEDVEAPNLWGDATESVNRLEQRIADVRDQLPLRHVEVKRADGQGKRVIAVGFRQNVFHLLPQVEFYATWPEALAAIGAAATDTCACDCGDCAVEGQHPPCEP